MNQILYIFRKDVRQHWYVIVLSLAIVVAHVRNDPRSWVPEGVRATNYPWLLPPLVVIGWMILIIRVIQGESLVGLPFIYVTALPEETTCPARSDEKAIPPETTFSASVLNLGSGPADFGISPVKMLSLSFDRGFRTADSYHLDLCPGVPLTFSVLEETPRTRTELTIDGIRLVDYRFKDPTPNSTATGVALF